VIANEPTIGMYRIQEHIRKTVPKIEKETERFQHISSRFDNACITLDSISDSVRLVEQGESAIDRIERDLVELNNLLANQ